jgi:hypothetical protein
VESLRRNGATRLDKKEAAEDDRGAGGLAASEGLSVAPESGVCIAAMKKLRQSGFLGPDRILIYNTGCGYRYLEA